MFARIKKEANFARANSGQRFALTLLLTSIVRQK